MVSRDHLDKAALVAAFLVGAAGSWGAKALGLGPFAAVAWTVAAMGFYVAAVALLGRLRIEPEAIGDNCYYLGFLLTLSSLSATLYELARSAEQAELMRSIVGGFGIALISTILGILLRVIFIQLRPDIVARDRETRIELSRAARELRLELGASVAVMKEFSTEAIQLAAEQGARTRAATEAAAEAERARAAALARTLEAAGAEAVQAIGANVGRSAEAAQAAIAASLGEMSRAVAAFAAAQVAAVEARAAAGDQALQRAAAVADEVEALGARVTEAMGAMARELGASAAAIEAAGQAARAARVEAEAARWTPPWPFARGRG
jgi:hypothetical protein